MVTEILRFAIPLIVPLYPLPSGGVQEVDFSTNRAGDWRRRERAAATGG